MAGKSKVTRAFLLVLSSFMFVSCGSIQPEMPDLTDNDHWVKPKQELSTINVPLSINLRPYFDQTNRNTPKKFEGQQQNCEGVSFSYQFIRNPIDFAGKGEHLSFKVNGRYALNLNYCPQCTNMFTSEGGCVVPRIYASCGVGEPMRDVSILFNSELGLTREYKLESNTKLKDVKAISPCKITVFQYNATEKIEEEIRKSLKSVEKDIDKQIGSVDLRPEVEKVWQALQSPIDLSGYGKLHLMPEKLSLGKMNFKGDSAFVDVAISSKPVVYIGKQPQTEKLLPPLSDYSAGNGFSISLDVEAQYDSLSRVVTSAIKGKIVELNGKQIIFEELIIQSAHGKQLNLALRFSGSKKGILYLNATPSFDSKLQLLSFPDIDYDIKTKNLILKSAKWLFDKRITDTLKEKAIIDMKTYLDEMKVLINEQLNQEISSGVYMSGKVHKLEAELLHPGNHYLFIRFLSQGNLSIRM